MTGKFKIGEKVAVYTRDGRIVGRVTEADGFILWVARRSGTEIYTAHEKQCRRLVPKKRKSVWIDPKFFLKLALPLEISLRQVEDWIEFREVVKK